MIDIKVPDVGQYVSLKAWYQDILKNKNAILRGRSALEYLEYFNGYLYENEIEIYSVEPVLADDVTVIFVDSFNNIEYINDGSVLCSTFEQAVNDMLADFEKSDEQALLEALSRYYYTNSRSFSRLNISPFLQDRFLEVQSQAIDYYKRGAIV
jgi:hypothetical protein